MKILFLLMLADIAYGSNYNSGPDLYLRNFEKIIENINPKDSSQVRDNLKTRMYFKALATTKIDEMRNLKKREYEIASSIHELLLKVKETDSLIEDNKIPENKKNSLKALREILLKQGQYFADEKCDYELYELKKNNNLDCENFNINSIPIYTSYLGYADLDQKYQNLIPRPCAGKILPGKTAKDLCNDFISVLENLTKYANVHDNDINSLLGMLARLENQASELIVNPKVQYQTVEVEVEVDPPGKRIKTQRCPNPTSIPGMLPTIIEPGHWTDDDKTYEYSSVSIHKCLQKTPITVGGVPVATTDKMCWAHQDQTFKNCMREQMSSCIWYVNCGNYISPLTCKKEYCSGNNIVGCRNNQHAFKIQNADDINEMDSPMIIKKSTTPENSANQ